MLALGVRAAAGGAGVIAEPARMPPVSVIGRRFGISRGPPDNHRHDKGAPMSGRRRDDPFTRVEALCGGLRPPWGPVLAGLLPILGELRSYRLSQLRGDALAGLTAAATLIPPWPLACTPWWGPR